MREVLQVIPAEFVGKKEIVPVKVRSLDDNDNVVAFKYRRQTFLYNAELGCFDKLKYPTSVRSLSRGLHLFPCFHPFHSKDG